MAVVASVVMLAGCSSAIAGSPEPFSAMTPSAGPGPGTATRAPSTTPSKPYLTTTPTLELTDRTTKPGSKLKFGQQAVIPFFSHYDKGLLGVTVTVESAPAQNSDIDALPLKDEDKAKLRGKTFYFARVKMTDIDGANFADVWAPTLTATTRSGGWPGSLLGASFPDVTGCEGLSPAPKDFSTPGAVYEQCELFFGTASDPVTSLEYFDAPYEQPSSRAVTWKK